MVKIAPSILSADFSNLEAEIEEAEKGGADLLHIDVMDGHFVPNLTIGPVVVESIRDTTSLPFDVHLMVSNPERFIEPFVDAGANILSVHVETSPHLDNIIKTIKDQGVKAGAAINPATPTGYVEELLSELDLVLLMSVNPGFGGQPFIRRVLKKVEKTRQMVEEQGYHLEIEVDGGITPETAPLAAKAGATILVAGSSVFQGHKSIRSNIQALKQSLV
ncbi:MAG: ribulose-phosphate 3-epimerase [Methanobacteriota archaeon]|nr:MAG: ribulose-phosphate 3-epimerase [Euryarchaeota archaeon]